VKKNTPGLSKTQVDADLYCQNLPNRKDRLGFILPGHPIPCLSSPNYTEIEAELGLR